MNFLKTFFITIILCNIGTLLNMNIEKKDLTAYTTEGPEVETPTAIKTPVISTITDVQAPDLTKETPLPKETTIPKEEKTIPQEIITPEVASLPKETPKKEKSLLEEWNDHLAALGSNWDQANNLPKGEWKEKAFELAKRVLEKNKNDSETLKTSFFEAIKAQTKQLTREINNLINEFDAMIDAIMNPQAPQEKKEAIVEVAIPPIPSPDVFEGLAPEVTTKAEEFPSGTELTLEIKPTSQTKIDDQWNELIAKIKSAEGNPQEILDTINQLAPQLASLDTKKREKIQNEFNNALTSFKLKKKLTDIDLKSMKNGLHKALSPQEYEQKQQREQEDEQKRLIEQQIEERLQEEKKKIEETKMQTQAALEKMKQEGKITEEKLHALEAKVKETAQIKMEAATEKAKTQILAAAPERKLKIERQERRKKFIKPTKPEPKAAEEGIMSWFGGITQAAKQWWYGEEAPTAISQELIDLEKEEIKNLKEYLDTAMEYDEDEKEKIIDLWEKLQEKLHVTRKELEDKNSRNIWIIPINSLLKQLVITYHIISIDEACDKVYNALPVPSPEEKDYRKDIIAKIKTYLADIQQKQNDEIIKKENEKLEQLRQKEEKEVQALLVQQKIKDEENRIKAEQEKLVLAASSYKNEKQQWREFLKQLSLNKQATVAENDAHTVEAIKKSHSLFNLATIIPEKKQQNVAQKLKQKFAVALLEQQKANEDKINIHRNMDQFNAAVNQWLE